MLRSILSMPQLRCLSIANYTFMIMMRLTLSCQKVQNFTIESNLAMKHTKYHQILQFLSPRDCHIVHKQYLEKEFLFVLYWHQNIPVRQKKPFRLIFKMTSLEIDTRQQLIFYFPCDLKG